MLTCKGNCYRNYQMCRKQDSSAIHQAYCTDSYNWCTSHCKVSYKGPPIVIPGILDNNNTMGTQGPAATGSPVSGGGGGGAKPGGAGIR